MLLIFNIIIAFLSLTPIILIKIYPEIVCKNHFRNHAIIFVVKILFISMFIYFFIFNLSISNYKIFIISGYINFTFFHIIEGLINQKILLKDDKNK
tara:strand:- start:236 stop:523 length:288 start_codon:yes stop_codon:yes gene_type:complete